jgi:hypothetical protein
MALGHFIFIACLILSAFHPLWIFMECIYQLLFLWLLQLIDAYFSSLENAD